MGKALPCVGQLNHTIITGGFNRGTGSHFGPSDEFTMFHLINILGWGTEARTRRAEIHGLTGA